MLRAFLLGSIENMFGAFLSCATSPAPHLGLVVQVAEPVKRFPVLHAHRAGWSLDGLQEARQKVGTS